MPKTRSMAEGQNDGENLDGACDPQALPNSEDSNVLPSNSSSLSPPYVSPSNEQTSYFDPNVPHLDFPVIPPSLLHQDSGLVQGPSQGYVAQSACVEDRMAKLMKEELLIAEEELQLRKKRLALETSKIVDRQSCNVEDHSVPTEGEQPAIKQKTDSSLESLLNRLTIGLSLPKIEIEPFSGSAAEFVTFISSFSSQIESQLTDPYQKLSYLIYYCRGPAKEAIRHCVLLPRETCFLTAMGILRSQYGRPHQVIQAVTRDLFTGPPVRSNDLSALESLLQQMRSCSISLSQLDRTADLDCSTNLLKIASRLPKPLQVKWAEVAESLMTVNRQPSFEDLMALVERRVAVASTEYGTLAFESTRVPSSSTPTRRLAAIERVSTPDVCPLCSKVHQLHECPAFLAKNLGERWDFLRSDKRCFRCLKGNHRIQECKSSIVCRVDGCNKRHNPLLHWDRPNLARVENTGRICTSFSLHNSGVQLGFVPVKLEGPRGTLSTYAFIDNGSDCTLIDQSISNQLGLKRRSTSLSISTLHGLRTVRCGETKVKISSLDGSYTLELESIISIDRLPVIEADRSISDLSHWPHLDDVHLDILPSRRVGLLIGCDYPELHRMIDQRVGNNAEPFAIKTVLGWSIRGPIGHRNKSSFRVNALITDSPSVESLLARLYDNEFQDSQDSEDVQLSKQDIVASKIVEASTRIINGHYELGVPWRETEVSLSDNYPMALNRLKGLERKLSKDPSMRNRYVTVMQDHIKKGHIRRGAIQPTRWYLPHHPVVNVKKPEKLRIVFDCAAKFRGTSLNDTLLQGPDITNSLTGVLHRFRRYSIALSADIREMFLQVRLPERDKWAFSLLWWKNDEPGAEPEVYEWNVHPFGATSSPVCANYALSRTFSDNIPNSGLSLDGCLLRQFYVDDFLGSTSSVKHATNIVTNLPKLLKQGGFDLVKWSSNNKKVLNHVNLDSVSSPVMDLVSGELFQRTLGLKWNMSKDVFVFDMIEPVRQPTRRSLLAYVASIFDPLGFIAPLLLPGKLILQDACRNKLGWDAKLDEGALSRYHKWLNTLTILSALQIPRCLIPNANLDANFELHVLSDASESGYGAAAYLCSELPDGRRLCSLLAGKSRVAPLKFITVPRLELTAALVASKLSSQLAKELELEWRHVYLWTDSVIVLRYLNNTSSRYATFVANRVRRIQELSELSQWRHVPSEHNPADMASRGIELRSAAKLDHWLNGPKFLRTDESTWPVKGIIELECDDELELKRVGATMSNSAQFSWFQGLVDRCQTWLILLRRIVWLCRFKNYLAIKYRSRIDISIDIGGIKPEEISQARNDIIRMVQRETYGQVFVGDRAPVELARLKPVTVVGIICLGGRIGHGLDSNPRPIIPAKGRVVELLIQHHHELGGHSGATHVLASIRRQYWIVKGMASVKRVLRSCMECRRLHSPPCQQAMASLPEFRTESDWLPFRHTGLDFFGPFHVKRGRAVVKRYGCLFTCMQVRAIHIEIAHSMSTDSFLMALNRFISRRGVPDAVYSDNGSNFVGAEAELRNISVSLNQGHITNAMAGRGIQWHFNPPLASHRGGVWERMIRTVRRILSHLVKDQVVSEEVLLTAMAEVERIVNDRPIAPLYDDPEQPSALCPNDLLLLRNNIGMVCGDIPLRERLTRRWRQAQHLANAFWKRWKREYLPTLQVTHKWLYPHRNLEKGDLVILSKVDAPRGQWPKGVISETYPGPDGLVRQVAIRTSSGIIKRDVRSVCLLEGVEERRSP